MVSPQHLWKAARMPTTIDRMGRNRKAPDPDQPKKPTGGQHKTPRVSVQFPKDWLKVARELARKRPTPTVWWLVELIKREAEAAKMADLPPGPWDREDA